MSEKKDDEKPLAEVTESGEVKRRKPPSPEHLAKLQAGKARAMAKQKATPAAKSEVVEHHQDDESSDTRELLISAAVALGLIIGVQYIERRAAR